MHKNGKWAKSILSLQEQDGKWGCFHSLSQSYHSTITTEQALRRLERLGYTIEDACIQKAVSFMDACLTGSKTIPDPREKLHDWDTFTSLILATWIRRFTSENANANKVANQWAAVISCAFSNGCYNSAAYVTAYQEVFGMKPSGGRLKDFVNFYPVSLLQGCLSKQTELAFIEYILNKEDGIYYIFDKKLTVLPHCFQSREASHYLGAIELLSQYACAKKKLQFVVTWLMEQQNENAMWDMGQVVNDKLYFPLSDDWRKKEIRIADCTERISTLLRRLFLQ